VITKTAVFWDMNAYGLVNGYQRLNKCKQVPTFRRNQQIIVFAYVTLLLFSVSFRGPDRKHPKKYCLTFASMYGALSTAVRALCKHLSWVNVNFMISVCKVHASLIKHHAMMSYGGVEFSSFLTSAVGGELSASRHGHFTPFHQGPPPPPPVSIG
jgi:hypothetical protein